MKEADLEKFKYLIDSRNVSEKERKKVSEDLSLARLERFKTRSQKEVQKAKLLQLKLKIREYIDSPYSQLPGKDIFSSCLASYVDTLYSKRKDFADDLNISSQSLSLVINGHRPPKKEFLYRLSVHSEKCFEPLGSFENHTWFDLDQKARVYLTVYVDQNEFKKAKREVSWSFEGIQS